MHTATCDNCQKECQVPFKPTGDRPVYCSDCFSQQPRSESRGGERSYSSNYHKPSATPAVDYSHQFEKLHKKLDNLTELVLKLKDAQSPGKFTLPTGPDKFRADED